MSAVLAASALMITPEAGVEHGKQRQEGTIPSAELLNTQTQPTLLSQLESVLKAPADEIDTLLAYELEKALASCQNREWAEMMADHGIGCEERDFVSDVKGEEDYSF
jgi:hypothetical protein